MYATFWRDKFLRTCFYRREIQLIAPVSRLKFAFLTCPAALYFETGKRQPIANNLAAIRSTLENDKQARRTASSHHGFGAVGPWNGVASSALPANQTLPNGMEERA
ncbi:hypothetical protein BQ8482_340143 [Mesorhizobium delmotii]|uniref:Uncharacterized protein n=1 Tax=Mesorhizobium delmotii TaxID=1631247 RepID=A0A2P9AQ09_9HYPH|nr:hypothetical protein BQ8482_340143 [Mesorhizobium delmotii]